MERKDFIRKFALGGSILLTAPVLLNSCSDDSGTPDDGNGNPPPSSGNIIDLSSSEYAALKNVGGFAYKGNIIIIRINASQYVALSKICTHESCEVSFNSTAGQVVCPCHGSRFDTSGSVLQGPATRSLTKYSVTLEGNSLKIS